MSDQDSTIFKDNQVQTPTPDASPVAAPAEEVKPQVADSNAPFTDLLNTITTEDGRQKYSDVSSALSSIAPAQTHIRTLEQENADLKEKLAAAKTTEDVISSIKDTLHPSTPEAEPVDYSKIDELVDQRLSAREIQAAQEANTKTVTAVMLEKYGDKAEEIFYSKAAELDMTPAQINALVAKSPKAALKLIGETPVQPVASIDSSVNTQQFSPQQPELSAKVPAGATTADMRNAWRNAGKKIQSME